MGKYLAYILIIITSFFIISPINGGLSAEPVVSSKTPESTMVTWEFESANNYISENITIRDNRVELDKIVTTWTQDDMLDFQSGTFDNISITDDSNLKLSPTSESLVLDVNTERESAFIINHNHSGFQTFKLGHSITISKIRFLGKTDGEVSGNLLISLQTKDGEPLATTSLPSTIFQSDIDIMTANIHSTIEANTTYRLFFESTIIEGDFVLIGGSKSIYSEGTFNHITNHDEEPGTEKEEESGEYNIELEIFGIEYFERGTFESEVFDAGGIVFWANVKWSSEIMENVGKVQIFIRTGNSTKISHLSWTTWRLITSGGENSIVNISAPSASYIQYKIILTTSNPFHTPNFKKISINYVNYFTSGSIETLDFILNEISKVIIITNFSASAAPNGQLIEYFHSMDSGTQWNLINANNFSIILNKNHLIMTRPSNRDQSP
jgi:hypothetical protein